MSIKTKLKSKIVQENRTCMAIIYFFLWVKIKNTKKRKAKWFLSTLLFSCFVWSKSEFRFHLTILFSLFPGFKPNAFVRCICICLDWQNVIFLLASYVVLHPKTLQSKELICLLDLIKAFWEFLFAFSISAILLAWSGVIFFNYNNWVSPTKINPFHFEVGT